MGEEQGTTRLAHMRMLALVLLVAAGLVAACGQAAATRTPGAASTQALGAASLEAIPAVPAAGPLAWARGTLPPTGISQSVIGQQAVGVAPSDGMVAYACGQTGDAAVTGAPIWMTRDGARTWTPAGRVFPGQSLDGCSVVVDAITPLIAVVMTYHAANDRCMACFNGTYKRFVTTNGGASWRALTSPDDLVRSLATYGSRTYALFVPHPVDLAAVKSELVVSNDGMRTWSPVDVGLVVKTSDAYNSRYATEFWLNGATGGLLALTQTNAIFSWQFLTSDDGGASWRRITTPQADNFYVAPPLGVSWRICGDHTSSGTGVPAPVNLVTCTFDGGRTWEGEGAPSDGYVVALAADGSALTIAGDQHSLERLQPLAAMLDSLGSLSSAPGSALHYAGDATSGAIWLIELDGNGRVVTIYNAPYA